MMETVVVSKNEELYNMVKWASVPLKNPADIKGGTHPGYTVLHYKPEVGLLYGLDGNRLHCLSGSLLETILVEGAYSVFFQKNRNKIVLQRVLKQEDCVVRNIEKAYAYLEKEENRANFIFPKLFSNRREPLFVTDNQRELSKSISAFYGDTPDNIKEKYCVNVNFLLGLELQEEHVEYKVAMFLERVDGHPLYRFTSVDSFKERTGFELKALLMPFIL